MRIGVINWDCAMPRDTYFGGYALRSLGDAAYRDRLPYYTDTDAAGGIGFHRKTQAEYDRELAYAMGAGIDYFAYCWYTDAHLAPEQAAGNEQGNCCDTTLWELTWARHRHMTSALRDKIGLAAILVCMHRYLEEDFAALAAAMKEPCYEKVDGRPMVFLFGGDLPAFIARLRRFPADFGTADPYIVLIAFGPADAPTDLDIDAVTAYACTPVGVSRYEDVISRNMADNEGRKTWGKPVLPHLTVGWNPMPRVDHPVPWTSYPTADYAPPATPDDITDGARALTRWMAANTPSLVPGHILTFAWNEFEEGAFLCPTLGTDGEPATEKLERFAECVKRWKEEN